MARNDALQGTLDLLVLKTLAQLSEMHGFGIALHIQQVSSNTLRVQEGSLYPALRRIEQDGWIASEWKPTENNRRAKYYRLTAAGRWPAKSGAGRRSLRASPPSCGTREMNAPRDLIRRLRSVSTRLFAVFRTSRIEDDVDAEVQSHLAMRAELLAARGMPPEQVQREARRLFGNRTYLKEEARNQELFPSVESVVQDIRYGLRLFRRSPGFTTVVVLMLGVGLGLNAAMLSVFDRVLIAPIQLPNADRLYMVTSHARTLGNARRAMSGPDFRDVRAQNTVFTGVAAVIPRFAEVLTGDGQPCVVNCASPTQAFFDVLGVRPLLGRTFLPAEFNDLNNSTLLVSYKFWKDQLGGDPHVIGRVIHVEDGPSVIVGVMPPMPDLYSDVDLWLKLAT